MSLSSKITLLFLLLFALMAACVYTHIDDFEEEGTSQERVNKEETLSLETKEENAEEKVIQITTDNVQQQEEQEEDKTEEKIQSKLTAPKAPQKADKVEKETKKSSTLSVTAEVKKPKEESVKLLPEVDTKAVQEEINAILKEQGIIFKRMSYNVTAKSLETIKAVAKILKRYENLKFEVAGHTDAKGDESFNQRVSEQRAQSVMNVLIDLGIDSERLTAKGYGEAYPIVPNDPQGYSLVNRRVEINITEE